MAIPTTEYSHSNCASRVDNAVFNFDGYALISEVSETLTNEIIVDTSFFLRFYRILNKYSGNRLRQVQEDLP
jgi:hypothetical protein